MYDRCYMGAQGEWSMMAADCWMLTTLTMSLLHPGQEKRK